MNHTVFFGGSIEGGTQTIAMLARRKTPAEYRGDDSCGGSGSDSYGAEVWRCAGRSALLSVEAQRERDGIPHSFTSGSAAEAFLHH